MLDTNILVSRFLSSHGDPARIFQQWEFRLIDLVVSAPLLQEYRRALLYESVAVRHRLSPVQIDEAIEGINQFALVFEPQETIEVIDRDPADNRILECAVAGMAHYIVTGDAHLLDLGEYRGIQILSPRAYLMAIGEQGKETS